MVLCFHSFIVSMERFWGCFYEFCRNLILGWDNEVDSRNYHRGMYCIYLEHPDKPLNILTMGCCFLPCFITLLLSFLLHDYFVYALFVPVVFVCTWNDIKADWKKNKVTFSFRTGWSHAAVLSNSFFFLFNPCSFSREPVD